MHLLFRCDYVSVRSSVGPSRVIFERPKTVFEIKQFVNDINNDTMSDDEVVASDVPPLYLFKCDYTCL